jgi:hypothetical protein
MSHFVADKRQRTKIVNNKKFTRFFGFIVLKNSTNSKTSINSINALCCLLFALFCLPLSSEAKITGNCSNCHTMHNSQNGSSMNFDGSTMPNEVLLRATCLGCHSEANGTSWKNGVSGAPIVLNTVEPTYNTAKGLAGGNFYYVSTTVDNTGHNIFSTNLDDTPPALGNTPPGGSALTDQVRCAGTWGCHGHNGRQSGDTAVDNQIMGIKGAHHGNDTPPLGGSLTNVADNYRFLLGIKGKEDADWEEDVVNTSHNEYKGAIGFSDTFTISYLCGECHGNSGGEGFHNSTGVGTTSPWLRHPTDIILPSDASKEYKNYTSYSMVAPVARPNPDSVSDTTKVTPGIDIVMCLSCHRAHASPNFKMMRWDYKGWPGNGLANGCNVCHTSK